MDRERAALGCFVTLDPAPAPRRADAKLAGRIHVGGHPYDRLHLWSMADYFEDRRPALPIMTDPYSGRPNRPESGLSGGGADPKSPPGDPWPDPNTAPLVVAVVEGACLRQAQAGRGTFVPYVRALHTWFR